MSANRLTRPSARPIHVNTNPITHTSLAFVPQAHAYPRAQLTGMRAATARAPTDHTPRAAVRGGASDEAGSSDQDAATARAQLDEMRRSLSEADGTEAAIRALRASHVADGSMQPAALADALTSLRHAALADALASLRAERDDKTEGNVQLQAIQARRAPRAAHRACSGARARHAYRGPKYQVSTENPTQITFAIPEGERRIRLRDGGIAGDADVDAAQLLAGIRASLTATGGCGRGGTQIPAARDMRQEGGSLGT